MPQQGLLLNELKDLFIQLRGAPHLDRYVLIERVGVGSTGIVYRARDSEQGREVALKALLTPSGSDPEQMVQRFREEGDRLAEMRHDTVVRVRDTGIDRGICYLVMDFIAGPDNRAVSLEEYATWFGGRIRPDELLELFELLVDAFQFYHASRIVHGNLKPQNVLLRCTQRSGDSWQAKIMVSDFGLTRIMGNDFVVESVQRSLRQLDSLSIASEQTVLSPDAKAVIQTYDYMSPEQRRGEGGSRRSDIFSLGTIFLRLLTGRTFKGFTRPSDLVAGIDTQWDDFILKATAQTSADRFLTMDQVAEALQALRVLGGPKA